MNIHGHDGRNSAGDRIAPREETSVEGAIADRDHPFGVRRRLVGALQRLAHVLGDWPGDQEHIGMARRGHELEPKTLEIVNGIVQRMDLELAAIARTGIDLADGQAAAEPAARRAIDASGELG